MKSKLYARARAMKQDGQPINLLPRYVHSRQKPLVEQQQQQLPTTRKEDFHCQFAGCTKICKSAGGLTLHVRKMHRVPNNWRSIKANPRPYFWSKVNEPSILLATISCYNWLFVCVQVLQFRSLFVEERTASNFHFEDHSRPQRPRSFWSAPRIATSGLVQHRKSAIHGLPVTLRMFRVKSDISDWFWSQSTVFSKPFKNGMSLDRARGRDSWCWPKGARPLGTRMFEDLFLAQAQLCKTSHFTSFCSSQSAVFALCRSRS